MIDWRNLMRYEQLWVTLSSSSKLLFVKLTFFHFPFENHNLFNPNDRENWSAWATALLQYRTCFRTIRGNSAENSLFKEKVYSKGNELIFLQTKSTVYVLWRHCFSAVKHNKLNGRKNWNSSINSFWEYIVSRWNKGVLPRILWWARFVSWSSFGVKHSLLTMHSYISAVTHETAAAVVQLWLPLAFRKAGREERNTFEWFSHFVILSQHKESN